MIKSDLRPNLKTREHINVIQWGPVDWTITGSLSSAAVASVMCHTLWLPGLRPWLRTWSSLEWWQMLHLLTWVRILILSHKIKIGFQCPGSHASSGGSTKELTEQYFTEININTARKLYRLFKVDFEMFGYNPAEYFKLTKTHFWLRLFWSLRSANVRPCVSPSSSNLFSLSKNTVSC